MLFFMLILAQITPVAPSTPPPQPIAIVHSSPAPPPIVTVHSSPPPLPVHSVSNPVINVNPVDPIQVPEPGMIYGVCAIAVLLLCTTKRRFAFK